VLDIPEDDRVRPTLVYTKSHRGDLYRFARSGRDLEMSIADRLDLCVQICIALRDMHANSEFVPSSVFSYYTGVNVQ